MKPKMAPAGKGEPVPEHPYPGQDWAEVRHDDTVTWLAYWKDPINTKSYKYVFLAATSEWKAESDQAKYEKARKLKVRALPDAARPRLPYVAAQCLLVQHRMPCHVLLRRRPRPSAKA